MKKGCLIVVAVMFVFFVVALLKSCGEATRMGLERIDKIYAFAGKPEDLDSLRYYCLDCFILRANTEPSTSCSADTIISKNCQEFWSEEIKKRIAAKMDTKEYRYNEMYGGSLDAKSLDNAFWKNQIYANKVCNQQPIQIEGVVDGLGSNEWGNYIDIRQTIRVFLEDSDWNARNIGKIKRGKRIAIGGLCYGQTELYGIKTKIIIGNAKILKFDKEFL
jgi:hypothetical protein